LDPHLRPQPVRLLHLVADYLIHAEAEFEDNVHTLRGTHEHERVDRERHEVSAGARVEYGLPVWSRRLGLSGRSDAVEIHPDGKIYPVEYKHGKRRPWLKDDLHLAAQALCLEEMLVRPSLGRATPSSRSNTQTAPSGSWYRVSFR
jgi:CRISPR/Cas system-associated exonuclease Cas4 (RecB family)